MNGACSFSQLSFACLLTTAFFLTPCAALVQAKSQDSPETQSSIPQGSIPRSYMIIGNSYSYYSEGVDSVINGLARAAGIEIPRHRLVTISGAGLGSFNVWELVRPSGMASYDEDEKGCLRRHDFRKEKVFDVVLLQDNGRGYIDPHRAKAAARAAERHIYDLKCFGIEPVLVMAWAPQKRPALIKKIAPAVTALGIKNEVRVIPIGLAFENCRLAYPAVSLYEPDGTHPSSAGTYLAGCVIFASLFHRSPVGLNYRGTEPLDPIIAAYLQSVAQETVQKYIES